MWHANLVILNVW